MSAAVLIYLYRTCTAIVFHRYICDFDTRSLKNNCYERVTFYLIIIVIDGELLRLGWKKKTVRFYISASVIFNAIRFVASTDYWYHRAFLKFHFFFFRFVFVSCKTIIVTKHNIVSPSSGKWIQESSGIRTHVYPAMRRGKLSKYFKRWPTLLNA